MKLIDIGYRIINGKKVGGFLILEDEDGFLRLRKVLNLNGSLTKSFAKEIDIIIQDSKKAKLFLAKVRQYFNKTNGLFYKHSSMYKDQWVYSGDFSENIIQIDKEKYDKHIRKLEKSQ